MSNTPKLSVIMIFPDGFESRRRALTHLTAQTAREQIELVMVVLPHVRFQPDMELVNRLGSYQMIELADFRFQGQAFAAGVRAAHARWVTYVEEHSFPEPTWAEALIRAQSDSYAAIGSAMGNANPQTLTSWVNLFEEFGPVVAPAASGIATYLGGHHTSYRRDVLLTYGDALANRLDNETALHIDLRAQGHTLYLAGDAVSNHLNVSQVWGYVRQDYLGQRSFAATRASAGKWSLAKRMLYVLASPLIPFVRTRRVIKEMQRAGRAAQLLPQGLPLLMLATTCGTAGETIGYLFGDSSANAELKAQAELNRARFLAPGDL